MANDRGFAAQVFDVIADRLGERSETVALFTETGCSFEQWCTWEGLAACRGAGWTVRPRPPYAEVGVAGSRESADLLVFDPASGRTVLLELAIVHDWSTNKWIDTLNGDTDKLSRPLTGGIVGLQLIVAVSLASPIDVNPTWRGWLGMSNIWNEPTELKRAMRLGPVGQMVLQGWVVSRET
ncbi:MAG: hypothetical protein ACYS0G_12760 [Planctomycetota bacterium]